MIRITIEIEDKNGGTSIQLKAEGAQATDPEQRMFEIYKKGLQLISDKVAASAGSATILERDNPQQKDTE